MASTRAASSTGSTAKPPRLSLREGAGAVAVPVEGAPRTRELLRCSGAEIKKRFGLRGAAFSLTEDGRVTSNEIAGALRIGRVDVEVRPKCLLQANQSEWRPALIEMMRIAGRWKGRLRGETQIEGGLQWFPDIAALSFAQALGRGLAYGPLTDFVREEGEGPYLRGSLRPRDQVHLLWSRPWHVAFESDELTTNNIFSQLLAFAGERLLRSVRAPFVRQRLASAVGGLSCDLVDWPSSAVFSRPMPPQHAEYHEAIEIARLLVRRRTPGTGGLTFGSPGLIVKTDSLFQEYVSGLLRRALVAHDLELATRRQKRISMDPTDPTALYVIPDDQCVDETGETVVTIDAKYRFDPRSLTPRPLPSEWHQVYASVVATGAKAGLLIYPAESPELHGAFRTWNIANHGETPLQIATTSVDVSACADPGNLRLSMSHVAAVVRSLATETVLSD